MSVKRYDLVGDMDGNCNLNEARMEHSDDGDYVSCEDYAALEDRCAALAAEVQAVRWAAGQVYSAGYNHGHLNTADELPYASDEELLQRGNEVLIEFTDPDHSGNVTDAFLAEVRAQGVEEFLRGSQLPYQIATVLADYDNVDDATLQTVIWSGQPPEPDGDVWHLEYVSRGNAIVRAVLNELRKGVQS